MVILGIIDVVNACILCTHGLIMCDSGDGTNTEEEDQLDDDVEGFDFAKLKYVVLFEWRFTVLVYGLFMWNKKFSLFYFLVYISDEILNISLLEKRLNLISVIRPQQLLMMTEAQSILM